MIMNRVVKFDCDKCNHTEVCRFTRDCDEILEGLESSGDVPFTLTFECVHFFDTHRNKE